MRVEEKLDYFAQIIMGEAAATKRRATRAAQARTEAAIAEALSQTQARADERVLAHARALKIARCKAIAAAVAQSRTRLWERKQVLVRELFAEVEARLQAFVASEGYRAYLEEGMRGVFHGYAAVQLMRRDIDAGVAVPAGLAVEPATRDFLGGFILFNENRTLQADFSLQTRLAEAMAAYAERG